MPERCRGGELSRSAPTLADVGVTVPVREGLFTDEPRLLGSRCRSCGGHHFPRHHICPYCSADDPEPVELSPAGTLWAWTAVTAAPPGYAGDVPFGFGVVELPEGLRVLGLLTESDPARLRLGQPMRLVTKPVGAGDAGDLVSFAFEPAP